MASQQTSFHSESKRLTTVPRYIDDLESSLIQTNSMLPQQTAGKNKAMNPDAQDKVDNVIYKLETLSDLFEFYMYARDKSDFKMDSLSGLCIIISDCVKELREAANE